MVFNSKNPQKKEKHWLSFFLFSLILTALPFHSAQAHRSADNEIDNCRIKVGFEKIHFSAYTPSLSGHKSYCNKIPGPAITNLVFDYEGKMLRNITIEFEITKEPEGTRIFYQEPKKIKTGNVNAQVDFNRYGAGNYLAHITIVDKDKKLDTHLPFIVGGSVEKPLSAATIFFLLVTICLLLFFIAKYKLGAKNKASEQS